MQPIPVIFDNLPAFPSIRSLLFAGLMIAFLALVSAACRSAQTQATELTTPTETLSEAQARGQKLFSGMPGNCATCHSLQANVTIIGPSLAGVASRAAERINGLTARQYIELSIIKPGEYVVEGYTNLMPPNLGKSLSSEQLNDLVEFLLTFQ
jgi:mono/diheme cytochrome c family protein